MKHSNGNGAGEEAFFDTRPDPNFLRALQHQKWTVWEALGELVDNSFGSARGNATLARITHDTKNKTITVLDNGQGMEALGRIFQLGNTIGRGIGDIGEFGSGGTMAIVWLPSTVEIWTLRDREISHASVTWSDCLKAKQFPLISNKWKPARIGNTPAELYASGHGTMIKMHLAPERTFQNSIAKRELASMYAPALRHGKHLTWTTINKNGNVETEELADPLVLPTDPDKLVRFNLVVDVGDNLLEVDGCVGLVPDLTIEKSRVSVGFGPRVIMKTRDCYRSPDGLKSYSGVGIAGWLDLGEGWQPYLTTTKNGMNSQPAWEALMGHVFSKIQPLLEEADTEKLSIELMELAINLEAVFDNTAITVPGAGKLVRDPNGDKRIREGDGDGGSGGKAAKDEPTGDDGDDTSRSAKTLVNVYPENNEVMGQVLCKAELAGNRIDVFVNKDHEVVQHAMQSKPINRELLNMMACREMALEIADDVQRVFLKRSVARDLEKVVGRERERLITRILMDGVVRKKTRPVSP